MSSTTQSEFQSNSQDSPELSGSALSFSRYCEEELERRRNVSESLDEDEFNEVVRMVLRKLSVLREEGLR